MPNTKEVIKDFSEYFNNSISLSLETIRQLKYEVIKHPARVANINMEIEQIFVMIRAKLKKLKLDTQIKKIEAITAALSKIDPMRLNKVYDRIASKVFFKLKKTKDYPRYKELVVKKEICIWECLEALGMTSKEKDKRGLVG